MKSSKYISLLFGSFLLLGSSLYAATTITPQDIQEQNRMVEPMAPSADEKIDSWADKFLERMGIDSFGEVDGKYFYYAQEPVSLPLSDPQFGNALINAYDKAMMDIYEQYAMDMYGRIFREQLRKFFQDTSTNAAQIPLPKHVSDGFLAKMLAILNKELDVVDKQLDKKLEALGVDPNHYKKLSPKEKKDLFKDQFIKKTLRQASGNIAGIFTIQSAYAFDNKGDVVVGVIAVVSPKTKQIAKDIKYHRRTLIKGRGRDIKTLIPNSPKELSKTLGTRLAYDLDGTPVIISYGMSSYIPAKDHYINIRLKQNAIEQAISSADAQIAMLVNGFMSARAENKTGELINNYVERELKPDSQTIEKTIKNIINITFKEAKAIASMRLQGISTVKKWRYRMPTGQKIVGAVRVWRYSTLEAVKKFKERYRKKNHTHQKTKATFEESRIVNDINDF